jgi:hypothetical protein
MPLLPALAPEDVFVAELPQHQREPIVISGAGMITCLGLDRRTTWDAVRQGRCGTGPLSSLEQALPDGGAAGG